MAEQLSDLYQVINMRKEKREEGSYTGYLFEMGIDKILKKCGEECAEMIIAAKNGDENQLVLETCDLIYHMLVLLSSCEIPLENIFAELEKRSRKKGNLKEQKTTDKNT